jgi:hypothetical protein
MSATLRQEKTPVFSLFLGIFERFLAKKTRFLALNLPSFVGCQIGSSS